MRLTVLICLLAIALRSQTILQQNYDTRAYNWTRTAGAGSNSVTGDLASSGSGKTLTLRPCPFGLSTDSAIYISVGSGTAEAAPITAISGSGGSSSCVITVTTSNSHSGAFKVGSSTAGINEAIKTAVSGGKVFIPSGTHILRSTVRLANHVDIIGESKGSTVIQPAADGMTMFSIDHFPAEYGNFKIANLKFDASNINFDNNTVVGIFLKETQNVTVDNCVFWAVHRAVYADTLANLVLNNNYAVNSTLYIGATDPARRTYGVTIIGWHNQGSGGWISTDPQLYLDRCVFCQVDDGYFNNQGTTVPGIYIDNESERVSIMNTWIVNASFGITIRNHSLWNTIKNVNIDTWQEKAVAIFDTSGYNIIEGGMFTNVGTNTANGIEIEGTSFGNQIVNNYFSNLSTESSTLVALGANSRNVMVVGNYFNHPPNVNGIVVGAGSDFFTIMSNEWDSNSSANQINNLSLGANSIILYNLNSGQGNLVRGDWTYVGDHFSYATSDVGTEYGSPLLANVPYWDWRSSGSATDYDVRMQASGGSATNGSGLLTISGYLRSTPRTVGTLGTVPANGSFVYCSDCTTAAICAGGGSGHMAISNGTNWTCE